MRWTTYKKEIKTLKKKNPAGQKTQTYGRWHWWWAWRKVGVTNYCHAWFEWVQRRGFFDKDHNWRWEYRYPPRKEHE